MTPLEPKNQQDDMSRREFFRKAGRGSVALGGIVMLGGAGLTALSATSCGDSGGPDY